MKLLFILLVLSPTIQSWAQEETVFKLSESSILELAKDNSPKLDEIKAKILEGEFAQKSAEDKLGFTAYAGYNHLSTKEKAIMSFMPVYSPVNQYQVGLKKNFKYGLQADLSASVDSRSGSSENSTFKDINTTIYAFALNLDLWKDLFGRLTKKQLENAELLAKQSKLEGEITEKSFQLGLRRVYWSLVANNEKRKISNRLYETAVQQANDAKKRQANSIADAGEVARYESQVAARKGSILYLDYERENLLKQLRSLLPELTSKELALGEYSLNKTVFEVLECTSLIERMPTVPYEYTKYDEVTNLLKGIQSNQAYIDNAYSDIDVKLSTTVRKTGVASNSLNSGTLYEGSYQDSLDDMNDNDRSGFEAGLMVSIPFGAKANNTKDVQVALNKRKLDASIKSVDNNLLSTHTQISRSVKILAEVIKTQKINSEKLTIRLKDMQKKYNQARIPVNALIQDQDALLNSDISIVDTQLAILNTLIDYFVVFTDTPCAFNRIK